MRQYWRPKYKQVAYLAAGWCALALAFVGALLPVMPTTVFLIIALACFSRSSERLTQRLLSHPKFGPVLSDWQAHQIVPPKAKFFAIAGMAFGVCSLYWVSNNLWLSGLVALSLGYAQLYVLSKPSDAKQINKPTHQYRTAYAWLSALLLHYGVLFTVFAASSPPTPSPSFQQPKVIKAQLVIANAPTPHVSEVEVENAPPTTATQAAAESAPPEKKTPPQPKPVLSKAQPSEHQVKQAKKAPKQDTAPPPKPEVNKAPQQAPAQLANAGAASQQQKHVSTQHTAAGEKTWQADLLSTLMANRTYPTSALMKKQQGVTYLDVTLSREGKVVAMHILKSSGVAVLDNAALNTVRKAQPLPKVPAHLDAPHQLIVPIEYFLDK
ncbi:TonB family protein [Pseudoalteromonas piscicida]|uniref:TonB family protein n=1 Tax=Pseudoalteromonas piscicida TaxID=43662 RepID=UPI0015519C22|nr:TonB family protein [Pseudoalteromonas piscicida]